MHSIIVIQLEVMTGFHLATPYQSETLDTGQMIVQVMKEAATHIYGVLLMGNGTT